MAWQQVAGFSGDEGQGGVEMQVLEFDILGQMCPSTLLFALKEVNLHAVDLDAGEVVLRIKTDHRHAVSTIPESVRNMGFLVDVNKQEGYYVIEIRGDV